MWKFLSLSLVILSGLAAEVPAPAPQNAQQPPPQPPKAPVEPQPTPSSPAPGVKNQTAPGRYHGGYDGGYDGQHGYGHRIFRGYDVPLVDDYVCDLDATLLLVTNSDGYDQDNSYSGPAQGATYGRAKRDAYGPSEYGRDSYGSRDHYGSRDNYDGRDSYGPSRDHYDHHGYGAKYDHGHDYDHHHGYGVSANADRLRCSIIANWDKDACTRCCRLSARRDRSISKHKIIGFLVDNNQLNYDPPTGGDSHGDNYSARKKRSDSYGPAQTYSQPAYSPPVEAPEPEGDYRCVCCAPKRYRPFIFDRFFRRHGHHHRYGGYDAPY